MTWPYSLIFQFYRLIKGFSEDPVLVQKCAKEDPKKRSRKTEVTFVKRDLEAKQRNDAYLYIYRSKVHLYIVKIKMQFLSSTLRTA